jgi:hypothetical protein
MYAGELLFPGGGDCFCSGHTLEIFLRAYRIWQMENGVLEDTLFTVEGSTLTVDDLDIGDFYQRWQGFGVASTASSADAFEMAGIGQNIYEEEWDAVLLRQPVPDHGLGPCRHLRGLDRGGRRQGGPALLRLQHVG